MNRFIRRGYSIQVQMVLSFILLVVLTAVAVGLPSIQIIRSELERQARSQTEQGKSAVQTNLDSMVVDLNQTAVLTSQRPNLSQLIQSGDQTDLQSYLDTLRTGANLDLLILCDAQSTLITASGPHLSIDPCASLPYSGTPVEAGIDPPIWILSSQTIPAGNASLGSVIVGKELDANLTSLLKLETGLEQVFILDGQPIAASLTDISLQDLSDQIHGVSAADNSALSTIWIDQNPYSAIRYPYGKNRFQILSLLPISDLIQTEHQLTRTITISIIVIALIGSLLGLLVARTISQPLERLEGAATALRMGDLTTPVPGKMRIREVNHVARALDDARMTLGHSLSELRNEKEWIEHLLESIVEGIITLDQRGRVTYFSRGAERILGLSQKDVLYRSCDEIFELAEDKAHFSQFIPPPGQRRKIPLKLHDNRQVVLSISGARFSPPEAGKGQVALVLRDVSDEEAMRRLLGDFLANITHEFRTPLSALAASVEILMEQLPDLTQQELFELLDSIHLSVVSLQNLIDNLLEGASIEAGQFRVSPQPADLNQTLEDATRILQPLLRKHSQRLCLEIPASLPRVIVDSKRTSQVMINLLSNAIKNTPQGGTITIKAIQDNQSICVQIDDEGPGIPPEFLPDLFVRFVHFESQDRVKPGAGLGLSVVKAIVEAQGGKVGAANRSEGGASFWFTVPLLKENSL